MEFNSEIFFGRAKETGKKVSKVGMFVGATLGSAAAMFCLADKFDINPMITAFLGSVAGMGLGKFVGFMVQTTMEEAIYTNMYKELNKTLFVKRPSNKRILPEAKVLEHRGYVPCAVTDDTPSIPCDLTPPSPKHLNLPAKAFAASLID